MILAPFDPDPDPVVFYRPPLLPVFRIHYRPQGGHVRKTTIVSLDAFRAATLLYLAVGPLLFLKMDFEWARCAPMEVYLYDDLSPAY